MQVIVPIKIEICISIYSQQTYLCLLEVAEDVVDLLGDFFPSLLLVTPRVPEAPGIDPIRVVGPHTPLAMAPEVAIRVSLLS